MAEEENTQEQDLNFLQKTFGVFGPAAVGLTGVQMFLHAPPPLELGFLVAAGLLAANSGSIYHSLRNHAGQLQQSFPNHQRIQQIQEVATTTPLPVVSLPAVPVEPAGGWSMWDKMMGRHIPTTVQVPLVASVERQGKILVDQQTTPGPLDEEEEADFSDIEGDDLSLPSLFSAPFLFSDILAGGFVPTLKKIYLGRLPNGTPLYCSVKELVHVALAGSTGNGKSSIMRMLLAQLCKAGARVLLLNPHYTRYDIETGEDWTPFDNYLYKPAMECRKPKVIAQYLEKIALEILPQRLDLYANSQPVGRPYFIVVDELPAIVSECKEAGAYLAKILREGRKVGIYLMISSQDFLVKTLFPGGEGGAVRECLRTAYYVGGDATTAKLLLDMPANLVPEDELGKGSIMFRGVVQKKSVRANVPYVDNEALYQLLGPSTYKKQSAPVSVDTLDDVNALSDQLSRVDIELEKLFRAGDFEAAMAFIEAARVSGYTQNRTSATTTGQQQRTEEQVASSLQERTFGYGRETDEPTHNAVRASRESAGERAGQAQIHVNVGNEYVHHTGAQSDVRRPESTTHEDAPDALPRMSPIETEKFIVAYRLTGNKDRSLKEAGVNTRYREHATEIIQTRGLSKQ